MLPADRLTLAIDTQIRSYKLLRWVTDAIKDGFIPLGRVHEYADVAESACDWVEQHYLNFPAEARPDRRHLRQFANFFSTYITSSFDVVEVPGTLRRSECGCYCPWCTQIVQAPFLKPKKLTKRAKIRAGQLMIDRVKSLALEEGRNVDDRRVEQMVTDDATRRYAGYSAYGFWLIKRMEGFTDGTAILALWRSIAWHSSGSPIKGFQLRYADFADAEEVLLAEM